MVDLPPEIAAESAQLRANVTLSTIKQSAESDRAIANILEDSLVPTSNTRGTNVNRSV